MKNFYTLFLLSFTLNVAVNAQEYKKFKFGFGLGPTVSAAYGSESFVGMFCTIEPAYLIRDDFSIGLRFEGAVTHLDFLQETAIGIVSFTVSSEYYVCNEKKRFFVGLGIGTYKSDRPYTGYKIGGYPRIGFDIGHFTMTMDYNIISGTDGYGETKVNYLGIRIGGFIGGGKIQHTQTTQ